MTDYLSNTSPSKIVPFDSSNQVIRGLTQIISFQILGKYQKNQPLSENSINAFLIKTLILN